MGAEMAKTQGDVKVMCECDGETFYLSLRVSLGGALVRRIATCVTCGQETSLETTAGGAGDGT